MDEKLMSIVVGLFVFPLVILEIIKNKIKSG